MTPVRQTIFDSGRVNCFQAAVASVLDLPLYMVPHFCVMKGDWWKEFQNWLGRLGLYVIKSSTDDGTPILSCPEGVYCIMTGRSPRADGRKHAVVGQVIRGWYQYVHDPHPDETFLDDEPEFVLFFGILAPEKLAA